MNLIPYFFIGYAMVMTLVYLGSIADSLSKIAKSLEK